MDEFEDPFEGVDPAALAAMEAAAVKAAAVDEDKYIANDPRAHHQNQVARRNFLVEQHRHTILNFILLRLGRADRVQ